MSPRVLAWLSVQRRPLSTLLAVLAVALSVAVAGRMARMAASLQAQADRLYTAPDMVVTAKGDTLGRFMETSGLSPSSLIPIHRGPTNLLCGEVTVVTDCVGVLPVGTVEGYPVLGIGFDFISASHLLGLSPAAGEWPPRVAHGAAGAGTPFELSASLVPQLVATPERPQGKESPTDVRVSARLKPTGTALDRAVFIPLADAQDVLFYMSTTGSFDRDLQLNEVGWLWLWLHEGASAREDVTQLVNLKTSAMVTDVKAALGTYRSLTATGRVVASAAAGLAVLLAALGTAALLMARFEDQLSQLAVLRAIGRQQREVVGWVLWEGLIISATGTVLGASLELMLPAALGFAHLLPGGFTPLTGLFPELPVVWGLTTAAGLLSGLAPVIRLYRMNVHEALRHL